MRILISLFILFNVVFIHARQKFLWFENYALEDGIPGNPVNSMVQDSVGFLWLATGDGLARYDGNQFLTFQYEPDNPNSLSGNTVNKLYLDSNDQLWIGTNHGLSLYNREKENFRQFIPFPDLSYNDPSNIINGMGEDRNGKVYFLSDNGRLFKIEDEIIIQILNINKDACKYMSVDKDNTCWIASQNIVYEYKIDQNLTIPHKIDFKDNPEIPEIWNVYKKDSLIYVAALKSDLIRYNLFTSGSFRYSFEKKIENTYCLYPEDDRHLWIGTSTGLKYLNTKTGAYESFNYDPLNTKSLMDDGVFCIFYDKQKNLWIGTERGLNVAYPNKGFMAFSNKLGNFPYSSGISSIMEDHKGQIWMGLQNGGIIILNTKAEIQRDLLKIPGLVPSSSLSKAFCIFEDKNKNIWIGTYIHGLIRYNQTTGSFTQFYPDNSEGSLPGNDIRSITEDQHGNLWIAVHGHGLFAKKKSEKKFIAITEYIPDMPENVNQRYPFTLKFDRDNCFWIGSSYGAVFYNPKTNVSIHYSTQNYLSNNHVSAVLIDQKKQVWLGTQQGLHVLMPDSNKFIHLYETDGLPHNHIVGVYEDLAQNKWIATINGIAKISASFPYNYSITTYNVHDGIHANDMNENAGYRTRDGQLLLGGKTGYTAFYPDRISIDTIKPSIAFTNLYILNKKVPVHQKNKESDEPGGFVLYKSINHTPAITLEHKYNVIGIEFTALNLTNPEDNTFEYKMEGFDKNWINAGNNNYVSYTNLNPGDYLFRVRAANSDGVWNKKGKSIQITILPPFWKTKLALILYLVFLILLFFYLRYLALQRQKILLEIKQQEHLKDLRTRFFINVSHELKTPLTLITVPLKKILNKEKSGNVLVSMDDLTVIYRNVQRLLKIMSQLIDFRKIELNKTDLKVIESDIVEFTRHTISYFDFQIHQSNIAVNTKLPEKPLFLYFDPDKMDKILYNIISNAIKFSDEHSEIVIDVQPVKNKGDDAYIEITIEDFGPGVPENRQKKIFDRFSSFGTSSESMKGGTGIGLSIVKEFVEMHHGTIRFESRHQTDGHQDTGTKVTLRFPRNKDLFRSDQFAGSDAALRNIFDANMNIEQEIPVAYHTREEESLSPGKHKVLIIEDDAEVRKLLVRELSPKYQVSEAQNGNSGLEKAVHGMPDIIVSDIMMPEMNGYHLCEAVKNKTETSHIPVILLTAKSSDEDEIKGHRSGADAFVTKPFNINTLISQIESLIFNRNKLRNSFLNSFGIDLNIVVPTNADQKFMEKLIRIIHENIADPELDVNKFTREMGMSRSQLYKKVNALANTSVKLLIRKVRLHQAATLLSGGGLTVAEVSDRVGFNSTTYFSKCFQEEFRVSPSKYAMGSSKLEA